MACDHCRSIDLERLMKGETLVHHSSFRELVACCSATGCQLCKWIRSGLERSVKSISGQETAAFSETTIMYGGVVSRENKLKGLWKIHFVIPGDRRYGSANTSFELFVAEGSKLADSNIISGRTVSLYPKDEECFRRARKWKDHCLENHGDTCPGRASTIFPTRVIDVGPSDGSQEPCLKVSEHEKGEQGKEWVALSHCWGTESKDLLSLSFKNIALLQTGMRLQELPPTFRDAVIVTRRLGYRYLWIDSLCIHQDDHEDWVHESTRMQYYYKNATLTISANSASGDQVGFLDEEHQLAPSMNLELTTGEVLGIRNINESRNSYSYTSRRAWTLQEFVLSPRSLQYMPDQLVWECRGSKFCESVLGPWQTSKPFFPPFPPLYWYKLVDNYLSRDLTYRKDILPAISGLAREFAEQSMNTYAAGIWIEDIHKGLQWIIEKPRIAKESEEYYAPSWSWASQTGITTPIYYRGPRAQMASGFSPIVRASLIKWDVVHETGDRFGRVTSGYIDLRGRAILASDWQEHNNLLLDVSHDSPRWFYPDSDESGRPGQAYSIEGYFDSFDLNTTSEKISRETVLFEISEVEVGSCLYTYALLLTQVKNTRRETYRRVGIIEICTGLTNEEMGCKRNGWEEKDVHII